MANDELLSGIRVLDFSWVVAGPNCTRIMATMGAQVIRVEPPHAPEMIRMFPMNPQVEAGVNSSGFFNNLNADKLSLTLNVRHPSGFELLMRLLSKSDVVVENFSSRVLESWGMSYEEMCKVKPDIIYLSMAGFGHRGRSRDYDTWGPIVQAVSGLTHLSGLPDEIPAGWGYSYMDHFGGYVGAMGVLTAIYNRNRTGKGQWIDLSQVEGAIALTGPHILDYTVNGRRSRRPGYPMGNRSAHPHVAPHNSYRTAGKDPSGQDYWITIACFTELEWQSLRGVMGNPAWTNDPKFATVIERLANEDELDAHIQAWTEPQDRYALMDRLQAAGVPAGVVQTSQDRVETDPQLKHWNHFREFEHPVLGTYPIEGPLVGKHSRTPASIHRHAPLFGEHNEFVCREILGLSDEEFGRYLEEGVFS